MLCFAPSFPSPFPPFPSHLPPLLQTKEAQDRYQCLHFYYAAIDVLVSMGHRARETDFSNGLTLCRRIQSASILFSRLYL